MNVAAKPSLVLPTILAVGAFAVLVGLGTWQLQRKAWKDALVDRIAARVQAPPLPFDAVLARARSGEDLEYTRVAVTGRWLPAQEWHLWVATSAGPGWHVYAPLLTAAGPVVIVNRGFVPDARRDPASRPELGGGAEAHVVGLLRMPEAKGAFTPDNAADRNIWYWRDLGGMARTLPAGTGVAPFFLDAVKNGAAAQAGAPEGGVTRLDIPNNHLQYALTWYGLAATLVGVYSAFAIAALRGTAARSPPI